MRIDEVDNPAGVIQPTKSVYPGHTRAPQSTTQQRPIYAANILSTLQQTSKSISTTKRRANPIRRNLEQLDRHHDDDKIHQ